MEIPVKILFKATSRETNKGLIGMIIRTNLKNKIRKEKNTNQSD